MPKVKTSLPAAAVEKKCAGASLPINPKHFTLKDPTRQKNNLRA